MTRKATVIDYILQQGGKPFITQDKNGLFHIRHEYREDEPEICTHISPKDRGTLIIDDVEYEISYLWKYEGEPCERLSRLSGGDGYTRHGNER